MSTVAEAANVAPAYIRHMLKLAYLAPVVLQKIPIERLSLAVSLKDIMPPGLTARGEKSMGQFAVKVYGPAGSILNATQQLAD